MENKITNRQVICDTLMKAAQTDKNITVVCSDSRGSASLTAFADAYPEQFIEMGIAEQNLVTVSAGLASCGKKVFAASPACFLSTRSYEQVKVDVAYSCSNVTLIGISGGVSYGALGMTHHSCQDIAAFASLPDMRVYLPSDRFQTAELIQALLQDTRPAYVRVSRTASKDIYGENMNFQLDRANVLSQGEDVLLVACGEMVAECLETVELLAQKGIHAGLLDMYCVKPLDKETLLREAAKTKLVVTVEEHSPYGGLGSLTAQAISEKDPKKIINLSLPDSHMIAGTNREIFAHYGLDAKGIMESVCRILT